MGSKTKGPKKGFKWVPNGGHNAEFVVFEGLKKGVKNGPHFGVRKWVIFRVKNRIFRILSKMGKFRVRRNLDGNNSAKKKSPIYCNSIVVTYCVFGSISGKK